MSDQNPVVAAIQIASSPNVSANLLEVERLVAEATGNGAGLVVLPENFAFLGKQENDLLHLREDPGDGPLQEYLQQLARKHGTWIVGGTVPLRAEDPERVRASCLVFDSEGKQVGRYDKIHLFDVDLVETGEHYRESHTIEPGDSLTVIESPFGRLGLAVCYDLRFPELFRGLSDRGAELICMPAAFTALTGKAHWEVLVRARAIENLSYLVAAAQGGFHVSGRETHGHSMVVSPWGKILAEVARGTGSVRATINLDELRSTRRNFPALTHRRLSCG